MSRSARARKYEEEKANKALGGAKLKAGVDENQAASSLAGAPSTAAAAPARNLGTRGTLKANDLELQWFKLLRGQDRLRQIANILVELAPQKVFDPRDIYDAYLKDKAAEKEEANEQEAEDKEDDKKKKKKEEKPKKLSKKEQIIAENTKRLQEKAAQKDAEKLRTLKSKAKADLKLETESGKLLLLLQNLKDFVRDQKVVDILDTLWEIEELIAGELKDDEGAASAISQNVDVLKEAKKFRSDKSYMNGKHIVDFQLTEMSDRLPPLNLHALQGKFKFDQWQLRVIELIENKKSVLITAPTSSGKTVLSTYVCASGSKVLFVVPTEPLAWQVAAMIHALKLQISLVVPTLTYVPLQWDVCVGTPSALESQLTKKIGFDFDWVIFDEVHALNNKGGDALQRLIRAVPATCRFLALSATIGNATQLLAWWETIVGKGNIELVQHYARFINLQRHVWTGGLAESDKSKDRATDSNLHILHPCVCLTADFLKENGFSSTDMALTPVDSYRLWRAFDKNVGRLEEPPLKIKDLRPRKYFQFDDNEKTRITLSQASNYEKDLKKRLEDLAKIDTRLTQQLLVSLAPRAQNEKADASAGKGDDDDNDNDTSAAPAPSSSGTVDSSSLAASVSSIMSVSAKADTPEALYELCFELQKKEILPAIVFQLDSVRCQGYFETLLQLIEFKEEEKHPNFRKELIKKQDEIARAAEKAAKGQRKREDIEETMENQRFGEMLNPDSIDLDAPHPEFCFAPPGRGIGAVETNEIQQKLSKDLKSYGNIPHPLIRALRRGIGVYIEGLPTSYHRVVQSLAQRGRLGIVLSDELLAYGVNMPFRTAVFFGDPGSHWLTPLLHQQMAGRAGRRGLDRQGHLVYCGFEPARLQELLRGELPDVKGVYPLYPTIPLQFVLHNLYEIPISGVLDEERMKRICGQPLNEFISNSNESANYYEEANKWANYLNLTKVSFIVIELVWELRRYLPESVAIQYLLEPLIQRYQNAEVFEDDGDLPEQFNVMRLFCQICEREPYDPQNSSFAKLEGYAALPAPHKEDKDWEFWKTKINESQQRILNAQGVSEQQRKQLLLPHWSTSIVLSNDIYASFVRNQIDPSLPTPVQHRLRERLWNIGNVLLICSNVLSRSFDLRPFQNLVRKCFLRIRYILDETFERNWHNINAGRALVISSAEIVEAQDFLNIPLNNDISAAGRKKNEKSEAAVTEEGGDGIEF